MADEKKDIKRVVRPGYTVIYKGSSYRGGAEVTFASEREMKDHEHQLDNEGASAQEGVTITDQPTLPDGDTQSTDDRRAAQANIVNPEHAQYDAEMTQLSQDLARNAHGNDPRKSPVPRHNISETARIITVEQPGPGELGAPLKKNSPNQQPPKKETANSKPGGREAQAQQIEDEKAGRASDAVEETEEQRLAKKAGTVADAPAPGIVSTPRKPHK